MAPPNQQIADKLSQKYWQGFHTDVDTDSLPPGLNEDVIRAISRKKNEPAFMLAIKTSTLVLVLIFKKEGSFTL